MRSTIALCGIIVALAGANDACGEDLTAATMADVAGVIAPSQQDPSNIQDPAVARALDILKREHLDGPPPNLPPSDIADRLGKAMLLGARTRQFLPELSQLYDVLIRNSAADIRAAVINVQTKAGRKVPADPDIDKLVASAAESIAETGGVSQHVTIARPDYKILIDASPALGTSQVTVLSRGVDGAKPERVTFSGQAASRPKPDGSGIETSIAAEKPRSIDADRAAALRPSLNGTWIDQDGFVWHVAGEGDSVSLTQAKSEHPVTYDGRYSLGLIDATHIVDNVLDLGEDLPMDVRQALAATYHPPFKIRLEYSADRDELSGIWSSGQVTYNAMSHAVSLVETPTWDKSLVLTRSSGLKVAQGAKYPGDGP